MRNLRLLDVYRVMSGPVIDYIQSTGNENCGAFVVPSPIDRAALRIVASADDGWDHVSVSRENRCPNWPEMEHVKRLFFKDDECCMQLHVPVSEHISCHPYTLHIWRSQTQEIPRPPGWMVAPTKKGPA